MRKRRAAGLLGSLVFGVMCTGFTTPAHHRRLRPVAAKPEIGRASYYGVHRAGRVTASGKALAPGKLTAASPNLPLGTKAKVTDLHNGRSVEVTVTDRGPVVGHRILDVSPKAADKLGMRKAGVATVKVKPLAEPKPNRQAGSRRRSG